MNDYRPEYIVSARGDRVYQGDEWYDQLLMEQTKMINQEINKPDEYWEEFNRFWLDYCCDSTGTFVPQPSMYDHTQEAWLQGRDSGRHERNVLQKICAERSDELENMRLINREQEQRLINQTFLLDDNKQIKAIHEADILSLKNLVRECDEYKIHLSQAQESINYWMAAADEARAQVTIARIQEREACAQVCENGKGE